MRREKSSAERNNMDISFASFVSGYTKLRLHEASGNMFGSCPFCGSGNSFKITSKNKTFICYVCGEKGTMSDFEKRVNPSASAEHNPFADETILQIYEDAAIYYFRKLRTPGNPGKKYLVEERKMPEEKIELFGLGYAPDSYNDLHKILSAKYSEEKLLSSGLFRKTEKGYVNDFFRNRVMFPIIGEDGMVIAFGGRALSDDGGPKYLNSPESELFAKRKTLYGYPYDLKDRRDELIICEGYMDCIALQYAGFPDSCAVLGTALTKEHCELIRKSYKKVILSLDSDLAGLNAAKKSLKVLSEFGITARILDLKPAKDPDEFLRGSTRENLENRLLMASSPESFLVRNSTDIDTLISILLKQVS